MAARKRTWTPDVVRKRIKTSVIAHRLTMHVRGKIDMSPTQVTAALGLLRKTLPDLSATELTGEVRQRDVSDEPLTDAEWAEQYQQPQH